MGDSEDIIAMAEQFKMNNFETERYEKHIEDIKSLEKRVAFWRLWNIVFQIIFFWNIVALALELAETYSAESIPSASTFFVSLNNLTGPITFWFGIISAFAFFLMIWTGLIRGKWEGKLTRASAYALAFISNIEHRDYDDRLALRRQQLQLRPIRKTTPTRPISKQEYQR